MGTDRIDESVLDDRAFHLRHWTHSRDRPLIIAHRGAAADAPENSLAAFRLAREYDADGVELDVMRCRTGEVVVFHDDDLARFETNGPNSKPRRVCDLGWDELQRIDIGQGERIPQL